MIHSSAIIHPDAVIASNVSIGPYTVIDADVAIDSGCRIGPHVVVKGPTRIGKNNAIFQFCSVGDDPQDKKFYGEKESELVIGNDNTIREFVSINRGTIGGGGKTVIGDGNWIMASVHIAHDCIIGNHTIFANNTTLAGHVSIGDHAILGGFTGVHQFCRIGCYSFSAAFSRVAKDIPPFVLVSGSKARVRGLNREGMKRCGYTREQVSLIKKAYHIFYKSGLSTKESLEKLEPLVAESKEVALFYSFVKHNIGSRGITTANF